MGAPARVRRVAGTFAVKSDLIINLETAKVLGLTIPRRSCSGRIG